MFADQTVEMLPARTTMSLVNFSINTNVAVSGPAIAVALGRNSRATAISAAAALQSVRQVNVVH